MVQHSITREMTITHEEFFRLLPRALKTRHYEVLNNVVHVTLDHGNITITLSPQVMREIGSLELPVTRINFALKNCADDDRLKFFHEFDLTYQKGGG